jgi:hypothetical protein
LPDLLVHDVFEMETKWELSRRLLSESSSIDSLRHLQSRKRW